MRLDILSFELEHLEAEFIKLGEKKFRAGQVYEWLHQKRACRFDDMSNISLSFRTKLEEIFYIKRLKLVKKLESVVDSTVKCLYGLEDGNYIECVVMEYKHGNSLCISTQVGCKMGCKFCASTIAGFVRNLEPSEMLLQLYEAERMFEKKISNIVLMGIGEPLDNYDNVLAFMEILSSEKGANMSLRHLSLSTCGLVDKIYELASHKYGLTLSISLHSSSDEKRSEIMPINKTYDISKLINSCRYYTEQTGRRISFEYALMRGVNDSREQADDLAKLLRGLNCHVNIIPINEIKESKYSIDKASVSKFVEYLEEKNVNATVRRTLGSDIEAACGQLRRDMESTKRGD